MFFQYRELRLRKLINFGIFWIPSIPRIIQIFPSAPITTHINHPILESTLRGVFSANTTQHTHIERTWTVEICARGMKNESWSLSYDITNEKKNIQTLGTRGLLKYGNPGAAGGNPALCQYDGMLAMHERNRFATHVEARHFRALLCPSPGQWQSPIGAPKVRTGLMVRWRSLAYK